MYSVTRFIFILVICSVCADDAYYDESCPPSTFQTTYGKLHQAILCNYDQYIRPVADHRNTTAVYFKLILKYFTYDPAYSTLDIDAWLNVYWYDEHLTWDPDKYDKINSVYLRTDEIWTPDLSVYNRAMQGNDPSVIGSTRCTVNNTGLVACVPSLHIDSLCVPNLSRYPYDSHDCTLRLGSWLHKGEEMDIKPLKDPFITSTLESNGEWEIGNITSTKYPGYLKCCPNVTYPSIEFKFKIYRLHGGHTASVVIPSFVIIILTFTSLALSPINKERLILCYVNLIVQFTNIQYLSWQIPLKGDNVPYLILFGRDSLLLAAFNLAFTMICKYLMQKQNHAPLWISFIVSYVIGCGIGRYMFLSDNSLKGVASSKGEEDGTNIIETNQKVSSDWEIFAKVLDFLFLISYVIVYFVMGIKFIP